MLCTIVAPVVSSWFPIVPKLLLIFPAFQPPESEIHRLALFWDDGIVDNSGCGCVVGWMGVIGCFHPISSNVRRIGTSSFAVTKRAQLSASAADGITN